MIQNSLFCTFLILFFCKITNSSQQSNNNLNSINEINNSLNQLNQELLQQSDIDSLKLIKRSELFSSNNSQTIITDIINRPSIDLSCYTCTTDDDVNCEHVNLTRNTELVKRCDRKATHCSVLRIEYKLVKESNWTKWWLERSCSENCEAICIQLGERTRLKYCQTCCNESQCNVGNHDLVAGSNLFIIMLSWLFFQLLWQGSK